MSAAADKIVAMCSHCSARMRVAGSAAGKRARCPKCGEVFQVAAAPVDPTPAAAGAARVKPAPAPKPVDDADLLSGLAGGSSLATDAPIRRLPSGPAPGAAPAGKEKGTSNVAAAGRALSGVSNAVGGAANYMNSLMFGTALSLVGALIGGGIWYAIARGARMEYSYIAILVGVLAGGGMALGYRRADVLGGVIAAVIAILGIAGGKWATLGADINEFTSTIIAADAEFDSRARLVEFQIAEELAHIEDEAEWQRESEDPQRLARVEAEIAKLSDLEVDARIQDMNRGFREALSEAQSEMFWSNLDWRDAIFAIIAVAAAFKAGSSGVFG